MKKKLINTNSHAGLYFWRDNTGHKIDCIVETGANLTTIEIKSSTIMNTDFFKGLHSWQSSRESQQNVP
jgi:hypothetical protein